MVVAPGTGVALQNRGHCFTLEQGTHFIDLFRGFPRQHGNLRTAVWNEFDQTLCLKASQSLAQRGATDAKQRAQIQKQLP